MSKLYGILASDAVKHPKSLRAHERLECQFRAGNASDSTEVCNVVLNYSKKEKRYTLHVDTLPGYPELSIYYNRERVDVD